jgi:hypothetical protein
LNKRFCLQQKLKKGGWGAKKSGDRRDRTTSHPNRASAARLGDPDIAVIGKTKNLTTDLHE